MNRILRALPFAAIALLLAACGSAPARGVPDTGIDAPAGYASAADGAAPVEDGWWRDFDDPGLTGAVERAFAQNHDLAAAAARMDEAAALARVAGADLMPSLQLALNAARQKRNYIGLPIPGSSGGVVSSLTTSYDAGLSSSWELDLWGRARSGRSAAMADLGAAAADFAAARLSIAAQTARAWFALAEAREQMDLARATEESYRLTAEQVENRFNLGLRTSLDLRLARSSFAGAEARTAQAERRLHAARQRLEILTGRYPAGALEGGGALGAPPPAIPGGLPAELVARRPDLAAAERRLAAAGARVSQSRAALYPRLSLTASGGTSSTQLEDLLDNDFSVWSLLGNLTQPLFQGGRLRGQVAAAKARERAALETFASAALRAYAEVEAALHAESLLAREDDRFALAADEADAARAVAEEQYRSGLVDFVTVLEAQRRALQARGESIAARRLRLENRIDLVAALGGGFAVPNPAAGVATAAPVK